MSKLLLILTIAIFSVLFLLFQNCSVPIILWFIILGLVSGLYYGWFNNDIFHQSGKFNNEFEKVQALWIHLVCGFLSSIGLFILYQKFIQKFSEFGLEDFALLIFAMLGITGLLPRTLWFLANKGELKP